MKILKSRISLQKIESEYLPNELTDTDEMYHLKSIIDKLPDTDKALLITYAEDCSMAKTGKKFSVSPATVYLNMKRIREKIKEDL